MKTKPRVPRNRLALAVSLGLMPPIVGASTVTVDSAADEVIGSSCTLRAAIATVNGQTAAGGCQYAGGPPDTIDFDPTVHGSTITLTSGELVVTHSVTIQGPGRELLTVSGNQTTRLIRVSSGSLTIDGLALIDGRTTADGWINAGAAIRLESSGVLRVQDSLISGHVTEGNFAGGAAIYSRDGQIEIIDSEISSNRTLGNSARAGAIYNENDDIHISGSVIANNRTEGSFAHGGAIYSHPSIDNLIQIVDSQIVGNHTLGQSADGGAMAGSGTEFQIADSLVSGNYTAGDEAEGGAIYLRSGPVYVQRSTISANETRGTAARGGAIATLFGGVDLVDSTIRDNRTLADEAPGGAVSLRRSRLNASGSSFFGNRTLGAQSPGGAIAYQLHTISTSLDLLNTTISGNTTHGADSHGGAIYANTVSYGSNDINLAFVTVADNRALQGQGGGLAAFAPHAIEIEHSIIAANLDSGTAADVRAEPGQTLALSYSLLGNPAGTELTPGLPDASGNLIGSSASPLDPGLAPLADLGGATAIHGLYEDSPALDTGDPVFSGPPDFDQRGIGFPRVLNGRVDIGAFEGSVLPDGIFSSRFEDN